MRERLWPIEIKHCGVAGVWICTQQVEGKTKLCDLEVACNCRFFLIKKTDNFVEHVFFLRCGKLEI